MSPFLYVIHSFLDGVSFFIADILNISIGNTFSGGVDIIGAKFVEQKNITSNALFKAISKRDSLLLYSYELKKKIDNDYELKKCFFQAVSNSNWSNKGYLVAFEINEDLKDEMARLNNSFGIGFYSS